MAKFRRKECYYCKKNVPVDYRDVSTLERLLTAWGKIKSMRESGTCAKHQRQVSASIKVVRYLALLPYVVQ